jgi:diacylglycerol kinase (ATP)
MNRQKKTLLILNPSAGKGKGKKMFSRIRAILEKKIKNLEVETSLYPGHLIELGQKAIKENVKQIISIGGDGTPFELLNGIYSHGKPPYQIELGMIPSGTGNSFLRDFVDVSMEEEIIRRILSGQKRKVDLIEFSYQGDGPENKYFLNILGVGLISDILKLTNEKLKFFGQMGYSMAVLIRLFKGMNNQLTLEIDKKAVVLKNSALVISNSKFTGGKMKIAPTASTGDGKVDVVVFNEVNRREIIEIFSGVFKGNHVNHPKVQIYQGKEISILGQPEQFIMADGELLGKTPLKIKVLPHEITVLI